MIDLEELGEEVVKLGKQFTHIFPKKTSTDRELFETLNAAYVGARYRKDYSISKGELQTLMNRVKKLQQEKKLSDELNLNHRTIASWGVG